PDSFEGSPSAKVESPMPISQQLHGPLLFYSFEKLLLATVLFRAQWRQVPSVPDPIDQFYCISLWAVHFVGGLGIHQINIRQTHHGKIVIPIASSLSRIISEEFAENIARIGAVGIVGNIGLTVNDNGLVPCFIDIGYKTCGLERGHTYTLFKIPHDRRLHSIITIHIAIWIDRRI